MGKALSPTTLIKQITQPRLILHGTADDVVPLFMGEALAQAAQLPLVKIEGADHTFTHQRGEFVAAITNWLSVWVAPR
jgi:pimeloyl-ACP methyl ester carboxylesterase